MPIEESDELLMQLRKSFKARLEGIRDGKIPPNEYLTPTRCTKLLSELKHNFEEE
jgi:hypothetical protein